MKNAKDVAAPRDKRKDTGGSARKLPQVRVTFDQEQAPPRPIWAIPAAVEPRTLPGALGEALYRGFEVVVALSALILFMPVMLVTALIIRLNSPGPVLFFHPRAGQAVPMRGRQLIGRPDLRSPDGEFEAERLYLVPTTFLLVKFRTMYQDAAGKFPQLDWWKHDVDPEECQDRHYKLDDDPRVTPLGKWLRRTTLDELPNLWNVIAGHIRLVGPRPEFVEVLRCYTAEQMRKFTIKPGLTCLAEVYGRSDLSVRERVAWDLEYVRNRSLFLDFKILFLTFWSVLVRKGAS
jgi:lipopolysaccharide/colanic/teichoic acid biosynthesis glycosyltransferase